MSTQTHELVELVNSNHAAIMSQMKDGNEKAGELNARLTAIEQEYVRFRHYAGARSAANGDTIGNRVIASDTFKAFQAGGGVGKTRIKIENATLTTSPDSGGALIEGDRKRVGDPIPLARTRLRIRDVLAKSTTISSPIFYTKQLGRTNNARVVSEGAQKPESSITFEAAQTDVKVIATWLPASKQVLADAPRLQAFIDQELTWMVRDAEEQDILYGSGVGESLEGLSVQATAYNNATLGSIAHHQKFDDLLIAIAQVQQAKIPASAIIVNDLDWASMLAIKTEDGEYLTQGPLGSQLNLAWQLPVVATSAVNQGEFMVGAFDRAVELIDREEIHVLISDSHEDYFTRNLVAILAEERVALAVKIPEALVYGEYTVTT